MDNLTNQELAQEISARIGNSPVPFDSVYSIALQIYNELGGEASQFDSVYSILLEILPLAGGVAHIDDSSISADSTWSSSKIASEIQQGSGASIDDNDVSTGKTWSSSKISEELGNVQSDPIIDASVLPDASENKSKLIRLDNGEKDVYAAKLLSSETITTNRLPDAQQIDKAYLFDTEDNSINYYKGVYHIICNDGETDGYMWYQEGYVIVTLKNAETITNSDKYSGYLEVGVNVTINDETKIITIDDGITILTSYQLGEEIYVIPATYNAPESAQIGNATLTDNIEGFTGIYDGTQVTFIDSEGSGDEVTGYKWVIDGVSDYIATSKQASEIYFYYDTVNELYYTDVKVWYVFSDNTSEISAISSGSGDNIYIPQLNAPDSEQIDNAYLEMETHHRGNGKFYYKGEIQIREYDYETVSSDYVIGHLWETEEQYPHYYVTLTNAQNIYGGNIGGHFADEDLQDYGDEIGWASTTYTLAQIPGLISYYDTDYIISQVPSTVKYQRTEITEEWGWEKVATEQYVDDAIGNINIPEYSAGEGIAIDSSNTISCTVKPIADVSALPDAEENKDSLLRLEGDKQVYISKGNPITPTNRVPDDEQIGKACLIPADGNGGYIYCGEYTITCADGELHWYRWGDYNEVQFYISEDDAEHATLNSKVYEVDYDSGDWSNKSASGISTTLTKSVIESTNNTIGTIEETFCPMTYKMPDSVQIGNAFVLGYASGDAYGYYFYTGEEVEFEAPYQGHLIGYKWVKTNVNTLEPNPSIFVITEEKAEDMTYYNTGGDFSETNGFVYLSMNGNITVYGGDAFAFVQTLNRHAADSEQVGNAHIDIDAATYYYTGEIATINGINGYKWELSNHNDFIITVGVNAENLYTNELKLRKGEITILQNSTSTEVAYSDIWLSDEWIVQYKRSADYQWQRVVTEDELTSLEARIYALEHPTTVE